MPLLMPVTGVGIDDENKFSKIKKTLSAEASCHPASSRCVAGAAASSQQPESC